MNVDVKGHSRAKRPDYAAWHFATEYVFDHYRLVGRLDQRLEYLFRFNGFVRMEVGSYEVHVVEKNR